MKPKLQYFPDTDTLYIELADGPATGGAEEIADGTLLVDYDAEERIMGITIERASHLLGEASVHPGRPRDAAVTKLLLYLQRRPGEQAMVTS